MNQQRAVERFAMVLRDEGWGSLGREMRISVRRGGEEQLDKDSG